MSRFGNEWVQEMLCRLGSPLRQAAETWLAVVRAGSGDEWRKAGVGSSIAGVLGERDLV